MRVCGRGYRAILSAFAALALVLGLAALTQGTAAADAPSTVTAPLVQQVSVDSLPAYKPSSKTSSYYIQHSTEVETDTFSWGSTIVSAFQVGRDYPTYGAQAIGWSTSTDNGQNWQRGILPGLTASSPSPNPSFPLVVNQSVGYDARDQQWIVPSVTYVATTNSAGKIVFTEKALLVNTSSDGLNWNTASTAVPTNVDKAWITCDNTAKSTNYGFCYVAYSQINSSDALATVTTSDGGQTWSQPVNIPSATAGVPTVGYNTNLVVQPNGTVVLVATDVVKNGLNGSVLFSTVSSDGGQSWSVPKSITTIKYHTPPGGVRALNKPSVDVDAAGTVYTAWGDCRFHASCARDDMVYATSTNGTTWSAPIRIALDPVTTNTDKFIPGIAVAPGTSGATAQLSIVYYTYVNGACTSTTCLLDARYATSYDGGHTWSTPYTINATSMQLRWLAYSVKGRMVGDYLSISFCNGSAITVVSLATANDTSTHYNEAEYSLALPVGWGRPAPTASQLTVGRAAIITDGATTTLTSTLTDSHTKRGLAQAPVTLTSRAGSVGTFRPVQTLTTGSAGELRTSVKPRVNTQYRWEFEGTTGHSASTSSIQTISVAPVVRAYATPRTVQKDRNTRIYGSVSATQLGQTVVLQHFVAGRWWSMKVRATIRYRLLPNGTRAIGYVLYYSSGARGSRTLRVWRAATTTTVGAVSRTIGVTVV